jgi:hypothetical protein
MNLTRTYWPEWKKTLQYSGFSNESAVVLEALAPLGFLFSQIKYLTAWIIPARRSPNSLQSFLLLLEDSDEVQQFVQYLKERENDLS